ncbi:MAG TPA: exosortase E/protease, VPEID-CTERM system [Bryobacteraceae bacterium]|nr:exosortase E/protease, VPEID-CTERM system [Bryobacteraceae bacterium]
MRRIALLALLLVLELLTLSVWLDTGALGSASGLAWLIGQWGSLAVRFAVVLTALYSILSYLKKRVALRHALAQLSASPFGWKFLAAHFFALAVFALFSVRLFSPARAGGAGNLTAACWLLSGAAALPLAALAFGTRASWGLALRATAPMGPYAAAGAAAACILGRASDRLWQPATDTTFLLAKAFLRPFLPVVIADPTQYLLGSPRFQVTIAQQCSGLEGAGLMLVFGAVWLWLFRGEFRFPRALLLIPAGIAVLYVLNAVRIAALILIGNAGAEGIAVGGFHSQAGWMAFIVVAAGFAITAQRSPWLTTRPVEETADNPTAAYLAPFLAILCAAMISRALSANVEPLYPLRFFAAAAAIWFYRKSYVRLDWKFGWSALTAGAAVFLIWIGLDKALGMANTSPLPSALAAWAPSARAAWLALRTVAAVVTVPIAEELAFRAFLIRRLMAEDFESVDLRRFSWLAALVSSAAFGAMHGERWIAGALAGLVYALVLRRRGRIGDAVAAHALTNALLAAWVLAGGHWSDW